MKNKKSGLPLCNEEQDDRPDVRPPGQGSYYYDDSTGYEVYTPDDEGENDAQSDDSPSENEIRGQANRQTPC